MVINLNILFGLANSIFDAYMVISFTQVITICCLT